MDRGKELEQAADVEEHRQQGQTCSLIITDSAEKRLDMDGSSSRGALPLLSQG